MMYSFNTLGFYSTQDNRQYDNTGNVRVLHHFETNKVPSFQLIVTDSVSSATWQILDNDGGVVGSGSATVEADTNNAGESFWRMIFKGTTLSGKQDGFYSLKVTYGSKIAYSDVFCWNTDVSEYLKVSAISTNVQIGEFALNMTDFEYLVYLDAKNAQFEYEIDEEGIEKTYGNVPLFNSRNKMNEFEITGYKVTHDFLAGLRILMTNGTVTLTYKGDEFEIYDIENPDKGNSYSYSDIIILTLKFKRKDYLQSINDL